jgi:ABC-type glycerol-3-phosphate transport system substrate-binding protein
MPEFSKRDFLKAAGGTAAATSLAGCTGMLGGDDNGDMTFWSAFWDDEDWEEYREWYSEEVEELTDEEWEFTEYDYDDLSDNVITGGHTGTPDVIEGVIEHPGDFVAADLLEPFTDRTDDIDHFDGYVDAALDAFEFQGELWALPWEGNGRALVWRESILEEYGYEEGPPEDAVECMELASEIHADNDDMNGFHLTTERGEVRATQEFLSYVYQFNEGLYEENGDGWELAVDADVFETILAEIYYPLFLGDEPTAEVGYRGSGWESNDEGYVRGEHAMIHCGPWIMGTPTGDEEEEVLWEDTVISPIPTLPGGDSGTYMEVKPIMVNTNSDNLDAAFDAAILAASPESYEVVAETEETNWTISVHEDVPETLDHEPFDGLVDAFEDGVAPAPIQWGPAREAIYDAIEEVIYEETDPETAAVELEEALREADIDLDPEDVEEEAED